MRRRILAPKPTLIDVFSGAGLFSAACAEWFDPILAVDISADAIDSYCRNVASVAQVKSASHVPVNVRCDLLIAGPPCQGFSTLGRRDPADERNALSALVPLWAKATRASVVAVENVPPFVGTRYWARMADTLRRLGYDLEVWTLDAADYGSAQRRVRSFTIASRRGIPRKPPRTHANHPRTAGPVLTAEVADSDPMHLWPTHSELSRKRIALVPPGGDKRDLMARAPKLCPPSWFRLACQATDVFGRIVPDAPANTLRCEFQNPSKGRYIHPTENRTLSLREGARLQDVPEEWQFTGGPISIARQIGNGVPLRLGRAIGRAISTLFFQ